MNNMLRQMQKVAKATLAAREALGKSVEYVRKSVVDEAVIALEQAPESGLCLFGVKDTGQIDQGVVGRLQRQSGMIFHTLDTMSPGGRAIDTGLTNPLTGRAMTGSSSGSCVNILAGINDLAVATDGGGSVLAPAISCNLYSIMGKGLGLQGTEPRGSTDGIEFVPGMGVISHSLDLCVQAVAALTDLENAGEMPRELVVPQAGLSAQNQALVDDIVAQLALPVRGVDFPSGQDRQELISFLRRTLADDAVILTAEGPLDFASLGDSVLGSFGATGAREQGQSGKQLLKVANMVDATAISLPAPELATGFLILAPRGLQQGAAAIALARKMERHLPGNPLFKRYFIDRWQQYTKGFF